MVDLAQVQDTHLILQPVGGLVDEVLVLGRDTVGVPDLESTRRLLEDDVTYGRVWSIVIHTPNVPSALRRAVRVTRRRSFGPEPGTVG